MIKLTTTKRQKAMQAAAWDRGYLAGFNIIGTYSPTQQSVDQAGQYQLIINRQAKRIRMLEGLGPHEG